MKERKKKKEKRYFVDWMDENDNVSGLVILVIFIIVITLLILSIIISYKMFMNEYSYSLNSYSVDTYQHLEEIATITIKDGYIDTSLLPKDVAKCDISYDKYAENTVYTYSLDTTNDLELILDPKMTITLSEKYAILSKESTYSSEEEYVNSLKLSIYISSFMTGCCFWVLIVIASLLIGFIGYQISKAHKKRDSEKDE